MKAIRFERFGGPEVLELVDLPVPDPGAGQVRVAVRVAGVNPADWKRREGAFGPLVFPAGAGFEIAGVVDAVGPDAPWQVGDEVIGWSADNTGYAEYTLAKALAPKPAQLSFEDAVAVPVAANTAAGGLDALELKSGETVLINGASGAVGAMAVQLAHAAGARVIGTASAGNQQVVRDLGAIPTTYGAGVVERVRALAPHGVDAIFDCAGHGFLDAAIELRGGTDRIVTIADGGAGDKGVRFYARTGGPALDVVERVARSVAAGEFRLPGPPRIYPLAEAAAAQRESQTGHGLGKIVLAVS
ncbi:NADP-dependent oxidoreductase [Nocardia sp. CDC159]|uniref:NADP-dependent oxidoreductase n=1 Tax=Nocardia pulmonis TaxID=2951408 RepID=A0A9X2EF20_9NOCA|nr:MULTISPECIES: NADP-dependent oxidoreductase [Nocardia]MCM6777043.1 NADP-dependent oxidoreductase [Nocardia pulmonis]MCM6789467.1 NADP-dependent oxidoreductase [Nocardia sp. CDC159]